MVLSPVFDKSHSRSRLSGYAFPISTRLLLVLYSHPHSSFSKPSSRSKSARSPCGDIKVLFISVSSTLHEFREKGEGTYISLNNIGQTDLLKDQLSNTVSFNHYLSACPLPDVESSPLKSSVPRLKSRTITGPL